MSRRQKPKPPVKQETNASWISMEPNPRGPHPDPPRETAEARARRLIQEQREKELNIRLRLDTAYDIYTEPLQHKWNESVLRMIPNGQRQQVMKEVTRNTLQLNNDHILSVTDEGNLEPMSGPMGDELPTRFYRTSSLAAWRLYRFYHQDSDEPSTETHDDDDDATLLEEPPPEPESRERRHKDQHRLVDKLRSDFQFQGNTYRAFLEHVGQVKVDAIRQEAARLERRQPKPVPYQLVVPYRPYRIKPLNPSEGHLSDEVLYKRIIQGDPQLEKQRKFVREAKKREEARHPKTLKKIHNRPI